MHKAPLTCDWLLIGIWHKISVLRIISHPPIWKRERDVFSEFLIDIWLDRNWECAVVKIRIINGRSLSKLLIFGDFEQSIKMNKSVVKRRYFTIQKLNFLIILKEFWVLVRGKVKITKFLKNFKKSNFVIFEKER